MSHLNYNHLYYFWMVCKQGSVAKAAEALFLTPQTVTGQIKSFEDRMKGKLLKRSGRSVEPTELGQLVFRYADKMFGLSYEMQDIVNYSRQENVLFDVGVADALSKRLVSKILLNAVPDNDAIHLRCFESTHEMLLEQLSQHKLDMILSDCPVDSSERPELFSKKLGECNMAFYSVKPVIEKSLSDIFSSHKLLLPGRRTSMGRKAMQWFDTQGLTPQILGEFDDAALMKAFALYRDDTLFLASHFYAEEVKAEQALYSIVELEELKEEYYVIFAERMIQHPSVKNICNVDFSDLFQS